MSVTRNSAATAMLGLLLAQLKRLLLCKTTEPTTSLEPIPETTSRSNKQPPAHRPTEMTAATVDGTTGFGIGCKPLPLYRLCTTLSNLATATYPPALTSLMQSLPSHQPSQPELLTLRSATPTLTSSQQSWLNPYQSVLRQTELSSNNILLELSQATAALTSTTLFWPLAGAAILPTETTGLSKIHGVLPGAITDTF